MLRTYRPNKEWGSVFIDGTEQTATPLYRSATSPPKGGRVELAALLRHKCGLEFAV
jgi:hypothetical protein